MAFTPGPHRTRDGRAAVVTRVTRSTYPLHGFVDAAPYTWTASGRVLDGTAEPLDLLYRDEPDDDCGNGHTASKALAQHFRSIPLTKGAFTIVDATDYEFLSQWKWHLASTGYAALTKYINFAGGK